MWTKYFTTKIEIEDICRDYRGSFDPNGNINEPEVIQKAFSIIKKNNCKVVLDIGACTGSYALLDLVLDIQIYSFEPVNQTFKVLSENIKMNGSNTIAINKAVSNYCGIGTLKTVPYPNAIALSLLDGVPSFSRKDTVQSQIEVITIDEFCGDYIKPDFIKIDVEGGELRVLQGAKNIIDKYSPIILCEYSQENSNQFGYNISDINNFLEGYNISKIGDNILCQKN